MTALEELKILDAQLEHRVLTPAEIVRYEELLADDEVQKHIQSANQGPPPSP